MGLVDIVFWVLLIIGGLTLIVGYPEGRRSAWGIALVCAMVDIAIIGYRIMQK